MRSLTRNLSSLSVALLALMLGTAAVSVFGQDDAKLKTKTDKSEYKSDRGFCSSNNWSSDRVSFNELRETTVASIGTLNVDGRQNGGISVKGEERSDILIRACVQAWGKTDEEAKSLAFGVRIDTGATIKADNPAGDNNWSVSYEIRVPRSTSLNLTAHNGGISVSGAEGTISFDTSNGGVNLNGVAGTVKGKTTNGGINVTLVGNSWKGSGLDVQTTNGGINVSVPDHFAAHVEAGTTNGGFSSDFASLQPEKSADGHRSRSTKVSTDLNGGGPTVRMITTNGGVRINSLHKE